MVAYLPKWLRGSNDHHAFKEFIVSGDSQLPPAAGRKRAKKGGAGIRTPFPEAGKPCNRNLSGCSDF